MGDYVHCTSRVVNILLKRLLDEFDDPRKAAPLRALIAKLTTQAHMLPVAQQMAPRATKAGTLDLTASTMLITSKDTHFQIGQIARVVEKTYPYGGGNVNLGVAVEALLAALSSLHSFWRQKTPLTTEDKKLYRSLATRFGTLWKTLNWKVSTWVHWTVCHSPALADLHSNFYVFSSIPTERRNVEFKIDVRHCYMGFKISRPYASVLGFGHVLNLSALDKGIALYKLRCRGEKRAASESDSE